MPSTARIDRVRGCARNESKTPHPARAPRSPPSPTRGEGDRSSWLASTQFRRSGGNPMKAFRFHETGGPEVLRFEDVALPEPGPGEIRLRHTAVALNFRDILVRRGQHAVKSLPSGLG